MSDQINYISPKSSEIRLAKAIADASYCSRRKAETLISQGIVKVDGILIEKLATLVGDNNIIEINGSILERKKESQLWAYHKPKGLLTTHQDTKQRANVFENLPIKFSSHIISIGRLDFNTEGLLLLTNDGLLARHLEHPSNNFIREYKVRAYKTKLDLSFISQVAQGLSLDGIRYKPVQVRYLNSQNSNHWFTLTVTEGKNREVRNIFSNFGFTVNRLIRTRFGPFILGRLEVGEMLQLRSEEVLPLIKIAHAKK